MVGHAFPRWVQGVAQFSQSKASHCFHVAFAKLPLHFAPPSNVQDDSWICLESQPPQDQTKYAGDDNLPLPRRWCPNPGVPPLRFLNLNRIELRVLVPFHA